MHQNFIQVLLVQNEEVGEPMGHHVGCAPVPAPDGQQAGIEKEENETIRRLYFRETVLGLC